MDFQFIIPHINSELLNPNGNNYCVKQIFDVRELSDMLRAARNAWTTSSDPFFLFDHFDTFFSLIENTAMISMQNLIRGNDLLYTTVDKLGQLLSVFLQDIDGMKRNSYLNILKMSLYLQIQISKNIDKLVMSLESGGQSTTTKKGQRKQVPEVELFEWNEKRFKLLLQLYNVLQLPLEKLWTIGIAEESFVNMVCEIAYRTLEHQTIKEKRVCDMIFQIFGISIKRYNHAISFPVRILRILRTKEIAVIPIANGIQLLFELFGITTIFATLLKDLVDSLQSDAGDTQTTKFISLFLSELGTNAPKLLIPHLSGLSEELLNLEAYQLRNCILHIMGDVITCELSSEELSDELKETRDEFLEDLHNHMMDVSAHVRSKVLQILSHMKNENAIPLVWQLQFLTGAVERLEDRTSLVRKNAVILIKLFLETNPFSSKLTLEELKSRFNDENEKLQALRTKMVADERLVTEINEKWEEMAPAVYQVVSEKLAQSTQEHVETEENCQDLVPRIVGFLMAKEYNKAVALVKQADFAAGNREDRLALNYEHQCAYYMALIKSYLFINREITDYTEEFTTQDQTVKFLSDSIEFSSMITRAVPKIEELLMSKTNSDVFEAVDFFTTAYLFGIRSTERGMQRLLCLVWSGDKEKRDAATKAYQRVLFETNLVDRAHTVKVVDNLCNFLEVINIGQFSALEVLIKEWIECDDINTQMIIVMFERFTLKLPDTSDNQSRLALQLLVTAAATKPEIATANINVIQSIGFGERGFKDPQIYASCLDLLMNLVPPSSSKYAKRIDSSHSMIDPMISLFKKFFFLPNIDNFEKIASSLFNFLYHVCQTPDVLSEDILKTCINRINAISDKKLSAMDPSEKDGVSLAVPNVLLCRLVYTIGYISMKEMIFLDIDVYNNIKYRQELKDLQKSIRNKNKRKTLSHLNMSASDALKRLSGTAAEPQQEPDEMLVGATAEDAIAEDIHYVCEHEILYSPNGIFPKLIPIIMEILKYPAKYRSQDLQQATCLALIRFMAISAKYCESNMPFLMNIFHMTKNIKMKCNIVIGMADFTFRFPNVIEPWTGHFYATLHENNDTLRLTSVKMLSHLILQEMIRVKGQISDLALCIVDVNDNIRNITRQFFKEIANKNYILYNVLPDIISRLSDPKMSLEEDKYQEIMRYIIGLIEKDKHVESLVEKLCLRFRLNNDERQWRDIAFCLSLLNYNEKTIKKLIDYIDLFKDKVQADEVYSSFKTIISNALKQQKPEIKAAITEFEQKLEQCLRVADSDEEININTSRRNNMSPPKRLPNRQRRKIQPRKKGSQRRRQFSSDESDNEEYNMRVDSPPKEVRNSARKKQPQQRIIETDSDSGESNQRSQRQRI